MVTRSKAHDACVRRLGDPGIERRRDRRWSRSCARSSFVRRSLRRARSWPAPAASALRRRARRLWLERLRPRPGVRSRCRRTDGPARALRYSAFGGGGGSDSARSRGSARSRWRRCRRCSATRLVSVVNSIALRKAISALGVELGERAESVERHVDRHVAVERHELLRHARAAPHARSASRAASAA